MNVKLVFKTLFLLISSTVLAFFCFGIVKQFATETLLRISTSLDENTIRIIAFIPSAIPLAVWVCLILIWVFRDDEKQNNQGRWQ